jgi:hypothetical protein
MMMPRELRLAAGDKTVSVLDPKRTPSADGHQLRPHGLGCTPSPRSATLFLTLRGAAQSSAASISGAVSPRQIFCCCYCRAPVRGNPMVTGTFSLGGVTFAASALPLGSPPLFY